MGELNERNVKLQAHTKKFENMKMKKKKEIINDYSTKSMELLN